jgi:hypothetical protein
MNGVNPWLILVCILLCPITWMVVLFVIEAFRPKPPPPPQVPHDVRIAEMKARLEPKLQQWELEAKKRQARKEASAGLLRQRELARQARIKALGVHIPVPDHPGPGEAYYKTLHLRQTSRYFLASRPKCRRCELRKSRVAHHISYKRIKTEFEIHDLVELCHNCHREIHAKRPGHLSFKKNIL